jgi:hypothetical protein
VFKYSSIQLRFQNDLEGYMGDRFSPQIWGQQSIFISVFFRKLVMATQLKTKCESSSYWLQTINYSLISGLLCFYDDFWHQMHLRACGTAWGQEKKRIFASVKF